MGSPAWWAPAPARVFERQAIGQALPPVSEAAGLGLDESRAGGDGLQM